MEDSFPEYINIPYRSIKRQSVVHGRENPSSHKTYAKMFEHNYNQRNINKTIKK